MLRSLRNFVVTFVISAILFGFAAYFVSMFVLECIGPSFGIEVGDGSGGSGDGGSGDDQGDGGGSTSISDKNGTVTFLLVGTDYQPLVFNDYGADIYNRYPMMGGLELSPSGTLEDYSLRKISADAIVLLRVNKDSKTFLYTYLPSNTFVDVGGSALTLSEVYTDIGLEALISEVTYLTGYIPDFYGIFKMEALVSLVNSVGGVKYNVPCDMKYSDPAGDLYIDLKAGEQTLNGDNALDLVRFNNYRTASLSRGSVTVSFLRALASKMAEEGVVSSFTALYASLNNAMTTDMSISDLMSHLDIIKEFSDYSSTVYNYPGSNMMTDGRIVYVPMTERALSELDIYR